MFQRIIRFSHDETGAITVDWTVLGAAAVALAIATTAVMTDTIDVLEGRMDDELRSRQLSDDFAGYMELHFEDILQTGIIDSDTLEAVYTPLNGLMNHEITALVQAAVEGIENDTLSTEEIIAGALAASVAYQRNILDDATLDYYFGFGGSDPAYMANTNAPTAGTVLDTGGGAAGSG